jgi:hypothetical protein
MLNINPETVCFIITKARQFQAKEEVVIPEVPLSATESWAQQILADHREDSCVQEVIETVQDLEPDQRAELVALMWLGRGDYSLEEWRNAVREAADSLQDDIAAAGRYLLAHPLVADYLLEGLRQTGSDCES